MSRIFDALRRQPQPALTVLALGDGENGERVIGTHVHSKQRAAPAEASSHVERISEFDQWLEKAVPKRAVHLSSLCPFRSPSERNAYAAEQYRIVRTKTLQLLRQPFRLVVTSPSVGDGKTLTALNLAVAMAMRSDEKTLLIDADLRRAGIHRLLQVPPEPGLADVLAGACPVEDAMFEAEDLPGLHIITAGNPGVNPTDLLDSSRWTELTEAMRRHFAHVIVDSPPIEVVADYDLIAAACDGVILVVRPDVSDRALCLAAIERLKPKLTGILVNAAAEWFLWNRHGHRGYYYYRDEGVSGKTTKARE